MFLFSFSLLKYNFDRAQITKDFEMQMSKWPLDYNEASHQEQKILTVTVHTT